MKFNFDYINKAIILICLCTISISSIVIAYHLSHISEALNNIWSSFHFLNNLLQQKD